MQRYFFAQDDDGHWYMVPEHLRGAWQTLRNIHDDEDADEFNSLFGQYRTGGGISGYSFCDPQETGK